MKKRYVLGVLGCVLLAMVLFCLESVGASSVTVRMGSVQAAEGSIAEVPIEVLGASNIGAMHLELVYDPSVLTPVTVTSGPLGSNVLLEFNPNSPGRLIIGLITLDNLEGSGEVATVSFKVVGKAGQTSALTLENCNAWEGTTHLDVRVGTERGQVTVVAAQSNMMLILLLLLLLLAVLVLLGIWRRRAKRGKQQQ